MNQNIESQTASLDHDVCVILPDDVLAGALRRFGLSDPSQLRISYLPGPGDVVGSFNYWQDRRHDVRVPCIAYSTMFFELVSQLGAQAQIISAVGLPDTTHPQITFAHVKPPVWQSRREFFQTQKIYTTALVSAVADFDPHIVVASSDVPEHAWSALGGSSVLILSQHNSFWPQGQSRFNPKRIRKTLRVWRHGRHLEDAVCISHECQRQLAGISAGRLTAEVAVPQVIQHYPARNSRRARRLLYLGRIEENKGIFLLLEAVAALSEKFDDISLVFAGSGGAEDVLHQRIAGLGNPHIQFLGRLPSQGVHAQIAQSDILVCPTMSSFNEGLAVVGFEAAAHGVPSILSSVVPAAELLGNSCLVFDADNQAELTQKILRFVGDTQSYQDAVAHLSGVRDQIYDRSLSWGSQLARVLARL